MPNDKQRKGIMDGPQNSEILFTNFSNTNLLMEKNIKNLYNLFFIENT